MPPQGQQFDPVAEFRQSWPNSGLSDQEVLKNLQDPQKFRSAFPHYTGVTDDEIRSRMSTYLPREAAPAPAPVSPQRTPQGGGVGVPTGPATGIGPAQP